MIRALALYAVVALVAISLLLRRGPAAEPGRWTVPGASLTISTPCAKSVTIEPEANEPEATGPVTVTASAGRQSEIDRLKVAEGATVGSAASSCTSLFGPHPSLVLDIHVPAGMPITIDEAGATDYAIGAVSGPLVLNLAGSGDVHAASANPLNATLSGSGDAEIGSAAGQVVAMLPGSGDLNIGSVNLTATQLTLDGSGDVTLAGGSAGAVSATLSGSGDLAAPDVARLQVLLSGDGDATIAQVGGPVEARLTGSGDLSVGAVNAATVDLTASGSGDMKFGNGAIGALKLVSEGDSDLTVAATVGDADLDVSGASDIAIPHLTGHLTQNNTGDADIKTGGG